jgi:4'-phosphopantetheinyl transferase
MNEEKINIIYPVILKVPDEKQALSGRESVRFLSQYAREAVFASAQKSGIQLSELEKDSDGAPMPSNGVFWSLSHKPEYVVGVTSGSRIGIDIEQIRPVRPALFNRIIDSSERQLAGTASDEMFYRCWTGKEAVLKILGLGLKGLSHCKLHRIIDNKSLVVSCHQKQWVIEHCYYDNHVASVVKTELNIQWVLPISGK